MHGHYLNNKGGKMMQNKYFQIVITLTEKERMMAEQYAEQKGVPIGVLFKRALVTCMEMESKAEWEEKEEFL